MESTGLYLLKSAVWLTGFTLVFLLILRNERYFGLNRIYLLSGIVVSVVFPFYTWHYPVILPLSPPSVEIGILEMSAQTIAPSTIAIPVYWWFYLAGIACFAFRLFWQTGMVIRKLRKTGYETTGPVKLVRTSEYAASFSFFSFVFVNPSITDIETKEIVNHESEHIQQRHWFDLLLVEMLCMLQWFNPFVWIYARLIRQNHEYLADERALQRTSNPAIYQATLLNQLLGAPVISLANSFSYSLNKKRFKMMKKKIDSPFRKLKMLLVLPLVALVFYAFAEPVYISSVSGSLTNLSGQDPSTEKITTIAEAMNVLNAPSVFPADKPEKVVKNEKVKIASGKVVNTDGQPLPGTSVIIQGTTKGAVTDKNGEFSLKDIPNNGELVFSFVGYTTQKAKPDFEKPMVIEMAKQSVGLDGVVVVGYGIAKTKTVQTVVDSKRAQRTPLIFLDGIIIDKANMDAIKPDNIKSINVLKDADATVKYGEKGNNGVIEIYSKVPFLGLVTPDSTLNNIRFRSVNSNQPPLYVLDGVIIDKTKMDAINPNDIESISVLKNGSATALYGEKAKNGLILIVSKKKGGFATEQKIGNVFMVVEEMPEFPGGEAALRKYIAEHVNFPADAEKAKIQGKVFVNFVINSAGKVEKAKVIRGIHPSLDEEAVRVVNALPDWKPGKQKGEAVDVSYTLPVTFTLHPNDPQVESNVVQNTDPQKKKKNKDVFVVVEQMPEFPGGALALRKFIAQSVKYPVVAQKAGVQGKVFVTFVVNSNGKVENAKIAWGIDPALDAEAIRVVNSLPEWKPGQQHGEAVDVTYTMPIEFKLQ